MGIPAERAGYMLPYVLPTFRKEYPDSEFIIKEAGTEDLMEMLLADKVNFIICPWNDEVPVTVVKDLIYDEPMQLIATKDGFQDDMFYDKEKRILSLKKIAAFRSSASKTTLCYARSSKDL